MTHRKRPTILLYFTLLLFLTACSTDNDLSSSKTETSSVDLTIYTYKGMNNIEQACKAYTASHAGFTYEIVETTAPVCQQELKKAADDGDLSTIPDIALLPNSTLEELRSDYPELFENSDISYDDKNTWLITTNCSDAALAADVLEYAPISPSQ